MGVPRYDFSAGSRDVLTVLCRDYVFDAATKTVTPTRIDLEGKTVEMVYSINGGPVVGPRQFIVRSPQQGEDLGKADYIWGDGELVEGELEGQITITGSDLLPHVQPGFFYLQIGPQKQ